MGKITLDQIFKIGILIIALIFLLFYFQASQNGRYQFDHRGSVIDTREGTIHYGYGLSINPVKGGELKVTKNKSEEEELRKAEEKKKTETEELNKKRREYIDAGFTNKEIDEYFAEAEKKKVEEEKNLQTFFEKLSREDKKRDKP